MKFKCLMWVSSVVAFASVVLGEGSVRDDMDQKIEKDIVRMGLRGTFSSDLLIIFCGSVSMTVTDFVVWRKMFI